MLTSQDFHDLLTLNINTVKKKKERKLLEEKFFFVCTVCSFFIVRFAVVCIWGCLLNLDLIYM